MDEQVKQDLYNTLRGMLSKYSKHLNVTKDDTLFYSLDCKKEVKKGQPMFFGATRAGKGYMSYYLMPVYYTPSLLDGISADLKKRMQGKSCFNFKKPEPALFEELEKLTATCYQHFQQEGWIE